MSNVLCYSLGNKVGVMLHDNSVLHDQHNSCMYMYDAIIHCAVLPHLVVHWCVLWCILSDPSMY